MRKQHSNSACQSRYVTKYCTFRQNYGVLLNHGMKLSILQLKLWSHLKFSNAFAWVVQVSNNLECNVSINYRWLLLNSPPPSVIRFRFDALILNKIYPSLNIHQILVRNWQRDLKRPVSVWYQQSISNRILKKQFGPVWDTVIRNYGKVTRWVHCWLM